MASGLGASGCFVGLKEPSVWADLGSSRVLLAAPPAHVMALSGGAWSLQPGRQSMSERQSVRQRQRMVVVTRAFLPVDPWAPGNAIDSQSIASSLFAASLFPYLGFLYHITKSKTAPRLTLFGFYFLLAFVGATIPAGIYAKLHYGTSLSNVDWLHGGAESLLTLTNLFIVFGLRGALREEKEESSSRAEVDQEEEKKLPLSK